MLNNTVNCSAQWTDMERPVIDHPGMNMLYEVKRKVLLHFHNVKTVNYIILPIYRDIRRSY
jgi:hypothetical protein